MRTSLYDYCAERNKLSLLAQWHPVKNGPLTPRQVSYGSRQKIWWLCSKGHAWQAAVYTRTKGSGCPYCAGKQAWPGENDLASQRPDLLAQWHPTKNLPMTPERVTVGSHFKAWWVCPKGHAWQAKVYSRACGGAGCPVCAGKLVVAGENDLESQFPAIAAQWHPEKNGTLLPSAVSPYSNRRVWWRDKLGHVWQASVAARTQHGSGCPYCSGKTALPGFNDLATLAPEVAAQWHPTLNGTLTPDQVTAGSHRTAWWECPSGHIWKAIVYSRAGPQKCGCPVCAGRVRPERQERYRRALAEME